MAKLEGLQYGLLHMFFPLKSYEKWLQAEDQYIQCAQGILRFTFITGVPLHVLGVRTMSLVRQASPELD